GALIRSAEIFGVKGIIIPERNAVKINETVIKTSTGAIEYVDIVKVTNISDALEKLKKLGFWVYGAEGDGNKYYYEEKYPQQTALVMGSEGFGIRKRVKDTCDVLVKIPMHGKINSLNVSVAGGIILSEISKSIN
ncbi:MAG: 23S rRNA (guanosine(2251)-2'-O)-methyltransferase RlmB, partial [Fusobacteriaceae bacterium]